MHVLQCLDTVIVSAKTLTQNLGMNYDEHYYRKLIFHSEYQKKKTPFQNYSNCICTPTENVPVEKPIQGKGTLTPIIYFWGLGSWHDTLCCSITAKWTASVPLHSMTSPF